eukprot:5782445-Karenia_brevis.AAC.1
MSVHTADSAVHVNRSWAMHIRAITPGELSTWLQAKMCISEKTNFNDATLWQRWKLQTKRLYMFLIVLSLT